MKLTGFDLEHIGGNILMFVGFVIQIIMIVMGAEQRIVTLHFVANRDGHTGSRILGRLDIPHPETVVVAFLTHIINQHKFVAVETVSLFSTFRKKRKLIKNAPYSQKPSKPSHPPI